MRRMVVGLSAIVAVVLTLVSWVCLAWWRRVSLADVFAPDDVAARVALGIAIGVAFGVAALAVVWSVPAFAGFRRLAREGFEGIEPRFTDMLIISMAAGWGEELFFRGVLLPEIGVWLAALAFVVAHGIVPYRSRGRWAMAAVLFAAGVGLGYVYEWRGLEASMAAHASYDLAVLVGLRALLRGSGAGGQT